MLSTILTVTVTATQPLAVVHVIWSSSSTTATPALVHSRIPSVSSSLSFSVTATISASTVGFFVMHLPPAFAIAPPQLSSPPAASSSVQPLVVPELAPSSTPPRAYVTTLRRKWLAPRKAVAVELGEAFLAFEELILELESPSAKPVFGEANLCAQRSALQIDLAATHADPTASKTSSATSTFALDKLRAGNCHLSTQVLNLASTADIFA